MHRVFGAYSEVVGSVAESYRQAAEGFAGLQRRNMRFAQGIYERSAEQFSREVELGSEYRTNLVENLDRQREAQEELLKETVRSYVDLLYSPFYVGDELERKFRAPAAEEGGEQAPTATQEEEQAPVATQEEEQGLPIEDYDELNVNQVSEKLDGLSSEELEQVRAYEEDTKNRETVLRDISGRVEFES